MAARERKAPHFVREWRKHRGMTQEQLASEIGVATASISQLETGKQGFSDSTLYALAAALDTTAGKLLESAPTDDEPRKVPVVGYVGAGAAAHYYGEGQGPFEEVEAPEGSTAKTVAAEVRGDSLGPIFEQWLVFWDEVRSPVTPDMFGRLCVVGLPDDRVLVKKVMPSRTPGLYHLVSNVEATITDQEIVWAARVRNLVPRG